MNACELTLFVTTIANTVASTLSDDELALAGALFAQLGDTLSTISIQRILDDQRAETNDPKTNPKRSN